jgi:spore germination protein YaaH
VHRRFAPAARARAASLAGLVALASCRTAAPFPVPTQPPPVASARQGERPLPSIASLWGFTAPWDPRSDSSTRAVASKLDVAITGWIQIDSSTGLPSLRYADDSLATMGTQRLALVTSWHGDRFHPETVRRIANDRGGLALLASRVGAIAAQHSYRGIVLDLEGQSAADLPLTVRVATAIADSAKSHGATITAIALPAGDTASYPTRAFFPAVDLAVIMLYDEHWSTSAPGPIATGDWVRRTLSARVADAGASRLVAALPLYGYLWRPNAPAQPLSFNEARRAALESNVEIVRDPSSLSLHAVQPGGWELWMSDAELLRVLVAEVRALGVTRIALWRLGLEDPAVWSVLRY